jgi:anthranilate phosphoribosyltransferase
MQKITEYLEILVAGVDLSFEQSKALLDIVFAGEVPEAQIAAFLTAMRAKGAKPAELAGLAKSLREHAVPVKVNIDNFVDTCGTGGASVKTFNISTAAAFVAAGAGVYVAKHGNRGITSKCGSADVLAELGVKIDCAPEVVAKCIEEAKIGFMFAPMFHPAMKYVQPVRKSLDFRTVFNILGPLANPAAATAQVMGVASEDLMETIVETLKLLGTKRAMVVHSEGLDEISTFGKTKILQLADGRVSSIELNPVELGISVRSVNELKGDDAVVNARIVRDILEGREKAARKDIVVLNAAAAIIVGQKEMSGDLIEHFKSAIKKAETSIADGRALGCLEKLIEVSNS